MKLSLALPAILLSLGLAAAASDATAQAGNSAMNAGSSGGAATAAPDLPSVEVVTQPHSIDQQIKLAGDYLAG